MATKITDAEFEEKVIKSNKPVLVDFFAEWCGPCKMMSPVIDELAQEYEGKVDIYKVDTDQNPETAQKFGIMSIPTLIIFQNGEVKEQLMGAQAKEMLKSKLDELN